MGTVKKAIVLAAGLGTRLRPLTCTTPKPLMPVWGEPMLARIVALLRSWGVDDIVVNCHYLHEQVEAWCAANGCRASYEPEILGTGGVLNPLRDWIGTDDFFLVNGDIVVEGVPDLNKVVASLTSGRETASPLIACALVTEEGPRTIEVEPESGFVTNWKSDDAGYDGTFTYCGFACLKAAILDYVAPTGFSSIVQAYEKAMMDGKFVKAVRPKDLLWTDAGTIQSYIDLNRDGEDNAFADIPQLKAALESIGSVGSIGSIGSVGSVGSIGSVGAVGVVGSVGVGGAVGSGGSIGSEGSAGSVGAIGSVGSVGVVGVVGSVGVGGAVGPGGSIGSEGSVGAIGSASGADSGSTLRDSIQFLGARGSDRMFFRIERGIIILYDDAKRGENAKYAGHAKWLKARGVPVPEVLADLPEQKTTVMAWGGSERKMSLEEYVKVVEALERFNRLGDAAVADGLRLEPPFDAALYRWERDLFSEYCLGASFHLEMSDAVRTELENVAALLEREPKALVHRDFQSTNVLWKNGELTFIDFQGMRLGPAAYDLASLVYDPYVTFTEGERRALVALYAKTAGRPELEKVLPYAAVQRLVQCLGAYGRLASVGQPQFGKYVLPALVNLLDAADRAGLDAVGALAEDLIARRNDELRIANDECHHEHCHHHS